MSGLQISQAKQSLTSCTRMYKTTVERLDDGKLGFKNKSLQCLETRRLTLFVSRNIFDWLPVGVIAGLRTMGIHWGPSICDIHPGHGHASWIDVH